MGWLWLNPRLHQQAAQPQHLENGAPPAQSTDSSTSTFRAWLNPRLNQKSAQPQLLEHGSIPASINRLFNLNF